MGDTIQYRMSLAMTDGILRHKASDKNSAPDGYWEVPDANHRRIMANAILEMLRALPLLERLEAVGLKPDPVTH